MFLPHLTANNNATAAEPAPGIVSPIPIVISRCANPRIDRGAVLDVLNGSTWLIHSFYDNGPAALAGFNNLSRIELWGSPEKRFRVLCHRLDLQELEPIAQEQPRASWEV